MHRTDGLDTISAVETPEGIFIELRPAGLTVRYYAFLIDWGIRLGILNGVAVVAALLGGLGTAVTLILLFLFEWFYPIAFELSPWGATPGKRLFHLKVVMDSGLPITAAASVTRNLLRVADLLPFAYAFGACSMLMRSDGKRLGDLAAATLVVHQPRAERRTALEDITPLAPARALSADARHALVALATRAPRLSTDRLDELAAIAASASGDAGRSGVDVTRRVLGVAEWVFGRRA